MRVILDLQRLLEEKKITEDEFEKFRRLSPEEGKNKTETVVSSIFVGMGIVGISPNMPFIGLGGFFIFFYSAFLGLYLFRYSQQWLLLGGICVAQAIFFILYPLGRAIWG